MSWATDRLEYLRGFMTRGEIQSETGIHWKTQEAILAGTQTINDDYKAPLRRLTERTAYMIMRETGFSVSQANKYKSYSPNTITEHTAKIQTLVHNLAEGSLVSQLQRTEQTYTEGQYALALENRIKEIISGMQSSKKTYEQWIEEYGGKVRR